MTPEITLNVIILIVLAYLAFLKKYFEKKGENLAIKEDIAKITKLTEETKINFTKQIEDYKKELNLKYEFINITKEYKITLFKKTVVTRQLLIKWANNSMEGDLIRKTLDLILEIMLDLFSNEILYQLYSENHQNIQDEFNNINRALEQGQKTGKLNCDVTKLQDILKQLQGNLLS